METLVSDCFPPIFSYLSLADLLHLRTVSRPLKQEVEDYLPTVRSLPLYLTTPRTPEEIARYENVCVSYKDSCTFKGFDSSDYISDDMSIRRLRFGTPGPDAFEDLTILQNQNHFRRSDFLILNHSSVQSKFLPFIQKLCPNIEKLALVIDHCDHYLPEVSKVFQAFPAIKVLLLEKTLQDGFRHSTINESDCIDDVEEINELLMDDKNDVKLPPIVYDSILGLNHLEELYLFAKRESQLLIKCKTGSREHRFVKTLLGRLRVFHVNCKHWFQLPVDCEPKESIEELACGFDMDFLFNKQRLYFPKLKKLINGSLWKFLEYNSYESLPRPSLKVFDISNVGHEICPISTQNLNYFTSLERFHCASIIVKVDPLRETNIQRMMKGEARNYDGEIILENLKNWTIKHLQILRGSKLAEDRYELARRWSKYFVKLETCTYIEPEYHVIRVSDLQN